MTPAEAAKILAVAAIFDRRTIGNVEAVAWSEALDGLDPRACAEAVRAHYRDTATWLMPAHVRALVAQRHRAEAATRHDEQVFAALEAAKQVDEAAVEAAKRDAREAFEKAVAGKQRETKKASA